MGDGWPEMVGAKKGHSFTGMGRVKAGQNGEPSTFLFLHTQVGFGAGSTGIMLAQSGLVFLPAAAFAGLSSTPSPGLLAHFAHCSLCFLLPWLYLWPHCEKLSHMRPCFPSPCPSLLLQCSKIPTPVQESGSWPASSPINSCSY